MFSGPNCEFPENDTVTFESYLGRSLINEEAIMKQLREKIDENLSNRFLLNLILK
jgi:hypothetical protein